MIARTIAHIWDSCFPRKHPGCLQPLGKGPLPSLTRGSCSPSPAGTWALMGGPGRFLGNHAAWQLHACRRACRGEQDSASSRADWKLTPEPSTLGRKGVVHYCRFYFLLLAAQNTWKRIWIHQQDAAACCTGQAASGSAKARGWNQLMDLDTSTHPAALPAWLLCSLG